MAITITGNVVAGKKLGRKIGFPTANIPVQDEFPARDGVYAARAVVGGQTYDAMAYLGRRPSVDNAGSASERILELYLFGFAGDLYGREVTAELLAFVRPEEKFGSLDELRAALENDRKTILEKFKTHN